MEGAMVRIPEDGARPVGSTSTPRQKPHGQGRLVKQGTVLAREMGWRRIRKSHVVGAMGCSDRQLYNYMARRAPIPAMQLGTLCDLMDMDPEELVDERNFLLEA
jgi:hypothetical protein